MGQKQPFKNIHKRSRTKKNKKKQKQRYKKYDPAKFISPKERTLQRVVDLHSHYGIHDIVPLDIFTYDIVWNECVNIHLSLLECDLIKSSSSNGLNHSIIRAIAIYATGPCVECETCDYSYCEIGSKAKLLTDYGICNGWYSYSFSSGRRTDNPMDYINYCSDFQFFVGRIFSPHFEQTETICTQCLRARFAKFGSSDRRDFDERVSYVRRQFPDEHFFDCQCFEYDEMFQEQVQYDDLDGDYNEWLDEKCEEMDDYVANKK